MSDKTINTRLYLNVPTDAFEQPDATKQLLDRLLDRLDVACVNLFIENLDLGKKAFDQKTSTSAPRSDEKVTKIINALQQKNVAVLNNMTSPSYLDDRKSFEKALENAVNMNFDGIHLGAERVLYERARQVLGKTAIIGCDCGSSKHHAMLLGESGADYIAFRAPEAKPVEPENSAGLVEMVEWWQQLFEVPCLAANVTDQQQMDDLLQIGADFMAIGPDLWPALHDDEKLISWLSEKCPIRAGTT